MLQFILSIVVAGVLLASAEGAGKATRSLANRLFGESGPSSTNVGATIRVSPSVSLELRSSKRFLPGLVLR